MAGDVEQNGKTQSGGGLYAVLVLAAGGAGGFTLAVLSQGAWEGHERLAGAGGAALACLLLAAAMLSLVARERPAAPPGDPMNVSRDAPAAQSHAGAAAANVDGPVLDESALEALLQLGGETFVAEIAAQFSAEGTLLLLKVARAVADADAAGFASHTHALRSSAANVGARRLYQLCLHWRETPSAELAISGSARFVQLQKEFDAAQRALRIWRERRPEDAAAIGA